ncbi:hypothetical protein AQUCO_00100884v1 [Aquilegia coerulea]|uniref:Major facilitator superfamily (MFS) profile domain-containing protein n=1 Tax=Aquilegia coerulea TaxID=218851 RepID=A0A2G5FCL0_AQUCA|nr:hypothetical protein AQUCO_00100884v1 [Aquilegia coerulea]
MEEAPGEFTQDGTVDLKGNPILRSKRGGWTACSFVVVYEVFERMAYFGISSNLVLYLTNKLHQGTVASANNVTNWVGTVWLTPILGAYVADAHLGRYWTFLIASAIYLSGMCLLTVTVSIPALRAPPCHEVNLADCKHASRLQLAVFYTALYILAIGTGGTKPNISTIGADQFDDFEPKEKTQKLSFFNWWTFSIFFGTLFANTFLVYIQDNVGWSLGYGLPTCGLAISILIFLAGTPFYRHRVPTGSPFTRMSRVIVAAIRKSRIPVPNDPKELYELDAEEYAQNGKYRIDATPSLRFLNKAAVKTGSNDPWMLSSVTQVEETKQMIRMLPVLIATIVPSTMVAQVNTLFVKQVAQIEFFYDQAPESMKSLGTSYSTTSLGIGNFFSSFLLSTVSDITERKYHKGWILNNLNDSHLDYYYAFFAVLNLVNLVFFVVVCRFYVYRAEVSDSMEVLKKKQEMLSLTNPNQGRNNEIS